VLFAGTALFSQILIAKSVVLVISRPDVSSCMICEVIVSEAMNIVGIDVLFRGFPSARAIVMANRGVTDAEVCRLYGADRKFRNLKMVSPNITEYNGAVFVSKDRVNKRINTWEDLRGISLGLVRGHIYSEKATKMFDQRAIVRVASDIQLLEMLEQGYITSAVMILHNALEIVRKNPERYRNVRIANAKLVTFKLYFYIHKKNLNHFRTIENGIKAVVENGFATKSLEQCTARQKEIFDQVIIR